MTFDLVPHAPYTLNQRLRVKGILLWVFLDVMAPTRYVKALSLHYSQHRAVCQRTST
jgi:hypothetical protein